MKPGDLVIVDFPGHTLHGQRVRVERIEPALNLAPPDSPEPIYAEVIFVAHPSLPGPVGLGPERFAGTPANARLREREAEDGGQQMELML